MPSTMYTVTSAARISQGWLFSESLNAAAVPWKLPCTDAGTLISRMAVSTRRGASAWGTPNARVKERNTAGDRTWGSHRDDVLARAHLASEAPRTPLP